jgi:hypothetical protein
MGYLLLNGIDSSVDAGFCVPVRALEARQAFDSTPVRLGDGPPWALKVQALLGPLIQAFTDETSLLRVGQKGNGSLTYIIQ